MDKGLKRKIFMFSALIGAMLFYLIFFGRKNIAVGVMIIIAAFMNLNEDLSYKPGLSFVKVLGLLLILGIVSYLNNPITIVGCILTFLVVFGTTFSSYHLFRSDVYMPYLLCYFIMSANPVSLENLPARLMALACGAAFIVGLNIILNRNKHHNISKETLNNLIEEVNNSIDLKLEGKDVSQDSFKIAKEFYLSLYHRFEYKYFPSPKQQSVLNIVKAFQSVGYILSRSDLSNKELRHIKKVFSKIREVKIEEIFEGIEIETKGMMPILLNLEIIANELNKDLSDAFATPNEKIITQLFKPFNRRQLNFRSVKFVFAFKMAVIMLLWEVLTMLFNLPFTKWLFFVTVSMMVPYVDDMAYTARKRIQATFLGIFIFAIILIAMPFIPISKRAVIIFVVFICLFVFVWKIKDRLIRNTTTTVISVTTSVAYINAPDAILLKILWVIVGVAAVSLFNFKFLPYSVEKETRNNLENCYRINEKSIDLIRQKCHGGDADDKTTLFVSESIVRENIQVNDDNRELYNLQFMISNLCNFILSYLDINGDSDELNSNLLDIIDNDANVNDHLDLKESVVAWSMRYAMDMFKKERELI
ncbi:FUSC family protein [Methanobrevibacter sp.]|uniref:FUSC family protein n=1 Tax=Methanobrevibacter sp. TaxID=66852 RepID=UPI0026000AAD|nr:FUSC family protein [Methanobrevibacter sp.]MBQ2831563.1 FUSC family protein [Methanobrevibacter sp.]